MNAPLIKAVKKERKKSSPAKERLLTTTYNGAFMETMGNEEDYEFEDDDSYLDNMNLEDERYAEMDSESFLDEEELF